MFNLNFSIYILIGFFYILLHKGIDFMLFHMINFIGYILIWPFIFIISNIFLVFLIMFSILTVYFIHKYLSWEEWKEFFFDIKNIITLFFRRKWYLLSFYSFINNYIKAHVWAFYYFYKRCIKCYSIVFKWLPFLS